MISRRIVLSLCLSSSIVLFSGPDSHAGGSVTDGSLRYDPYGGTTIREILIRELEFEVLQAEIEVAKANLDAALLEQLLFELIWMSTKQYSPDVVRAIFPGPVGEAGAQATHIMLRVLELAILE